MRLPTWVVRMRSMLRFILGSFEKLFVRLETLTEAGLGGGPCVVFMRWPPAASAGAGPIVRAAAAPRPEQRQSRPKNSATRPPFRPDRHRPFACTVGRRHPDRP